MVCRCQHRFLLIAFITFKSKFKVKTSCLNVLLNLSSVFANNKGAHQPAHRRSMNSAFLLRIVKIVISRLAACKILIL